MGPAIVLDIDETGVAGKFQSQTFKIAPRCVRKLNAASPDFPAGSRDVGALLRY